MSILTSRASRAVNWKLTVVVKRLAILGVYVLLYHLVRYAS